MRTAKSFQQKFPQTLRDLFFFRLTSLRITNCQRLVTEMAIKLQCTWYDFDKLLNIQDLLFCQNTSESNADFQPIRRWIFILEKENCFRQSKSSDLCHSEVLWSRKVFEKNLKLLQQFQLKVRPSKFIQTACGSNSEHLPRYACESRLASSLWDKQPSET